MEFKNLDTLTSFSTLKKLPHLQVKDLLSKERISSANVHIGGGLTFNYSALPVHEEHIKALANLCEEQQLIEKYEALLRGEVINTGEKRLVLHHLTRGNALGSDNIILADSVNKEAFYKEQKNKIADFAIKIRNGEITGSTNKKFTQVVQIGIGGSDLGPRAMYLALHGWAKGEHKEVIEASFISNVDPDDASAILNEIDIETSLFILVSKSGTTQETLTNYEFVKQAITNTHIEGIDPSKHFVAVTSNTSPLATSKEVMDSFYIDDYIGGRYSSTSAVGTLILSIAFGKDVVDEFLLGAHQGDKAALEKDITKNGALLDAAIGVYLRNVLEYPNTAILPYSQALSRFPAHLQQLDMESNGKRVNRDGKELSYSTGPVLFGEPGTNGQHSFYQLLHQGTDITPLQFIGFKRNQRNQDILIENSTSQEKLLANLIAQIVAFAIGKDDSNNNKKFTGNRCSSLIFGNRLDPRALGALLAHYENKVMFQGFLWNINSFDQEGVQLGKVLAKKVLDGAEGDDILTSYIDLLK